MALRSVARGLIPERRVSEERDAALALGASAMG
jgi:hypothetical protein